MKKGKIIWFITCIIMFFGAIGLAYFTGNVLNEYNSTKCLVCADIYNRSSAKYSNSTADKSGVFVIKTANSLDVSKQIADASKRCGNRLLLDLDDLKINDFMGEYLSSGMDKTDDFILLKKLSFVSRTKRLHKNLSVGIVTADKNLAEKCEEYIACDTIIINSECKSAEFKPTDSSMPDLKSDGNTIKAVVYTNANERSDISLDSKIYRARVDEGNCVPDKIARKTAIISEMLNEGEYKLNCGDMSAKLSVKPVATTYGRIAEVVANSAEWVYNGPKGEGEGKYTPVLSPLPIGTTDMVVSEKDGISLLSSNHRIYNESDSKGEVLKFTEGSLPSFNVISLLNVSQTERGDTKMTFKSAYKAPFQVLLPEQKYVAAGITDPRPNCTIAEPEFNYIDIRFFYSSALGNVKLPENSIFKSAEWRYEYGDFTLRLHLKNKGKFYGYHAVFNENGDLEFTFNEPPKSIDKAVVMLDAGHGGEDPGAVSPDESIHEDKLNLKLTYRIKERLEKAGARVVLTRKEDNEEPTLEERARLCSDEMPDLFISIHRNASENSKTIGYSNYYYYAWSKSFADSVFSTASTLFKPNGVEYYPFYVTRVTECPAILTENGYVSNSEEAKKLATDEFDNSVADKTVEGILKYLTDNSK